MEQKLNIEAINLQNLFKRDSGKELPQRLTLHRWGEKTYKDNKKKIFNILEGCNKNGIFVNKDLTNILIPEFSTRNLGEFFEVENILYSCSDWHRFDEYIIKKGKSEYKGVTFDQYIMPFDHFELLGRPKEIFIDYHKQLNSKKSRILSAQ